MIRITGLSGTGLDIQGMIDALVNAERVPVFRLQNSIADQQIKLASWNNVSRDMSDLQSKVERLTSFSSWQQLTSEFSDEAVATVFAADGAVNGRYDINVSQLAQSHRIGSDAQIDTSSDLGLSGEITLGGVDITIASGSSLKDIRDAINTASSSMAEEDKVRATIIDTTLVLERDQTGETEINIGNDSDKILKDLGILNKNKIKNELQTGLNMDAVVNGIDISRSSNTGLTDVIEGVTLNVKDTGTAELTVGRDVASIRSMIEDFIGAYNTSITSVGNESSFDVGESSTGAGVLQGESSLRTLTQRLRKIVTGTSTVGVDPAFDSLRKIGIWTTGEANQIQIVDGEALDDALLNNFEEVEDLFRDFDGGVLRNMRDYLDTVTRPVDGTIASREARVQNTIDESFDQIDRVERRLVSFEEDLIGRFARLEAALARMNQQSAFISSLLPSAP